MNEIYYIGFDVHKKSVSYCAKTASGEIVREGELRGAARSAAGVGGGAVATLAGSDGSDAVQRLDLRHAEALCAATRHGTSGAHEGDYRRARRRATASMPAPLPTCCAATCCRPAMCSRRRCATCDGCSAIAISSSRQSVRMQNKMAGLLMETGAPFVKAKLHGKKYFTELLQALEEVPESVKDLLKMSRGAMELFEATQKQLIKRLLNEPALQARVERLTSIPGVGPITALTWALEIVDPFRFPSIGDAVSYCGLTAAFRSSAGKEQRGPLSKQRNAWLQSTLIEAAKLAPRWNSQLAEVHERELQRGHRNRATLQVARKLVAYLMAVDKSGKPFQLRRCAGGRNCSSSEEKSEGPASAGGSATDLSLFGQRSAGCSSRHRDCARECKLPDAP